MSRVVALSLTVSLLATSAGLAAQQCDRQDTTNSGNNICACVAEAVPGKPIGELTNVSGNVLASGKGGYVPAKATMPIFVGDSVLVGAESSALVIVGNCQHQMGPNSSFVVRESNRCGCVATTEAQAGPQGGGGTALFAGLAGAGAVGGLLLLKPSNPASP